MEQKFTGIRIRQILEKISERSLKKERPRHSSDTWEQIQRNARWFEASRAFFIDENVFMYEYFLLHSLLLVAGVHVNSVGGQIFHRDNSITNNDQTLQTADKGK